MNRLLWIAGQRTDWPGTDELGRSPGACHESVMRVYHVLDYAMDLLDRGCEAEHVLRIVADLGYPTPRLRRLSSASDMLGKMTAAPTIVAERDETGTGSAERSEVERDGEAGAPKS